MLTCEPALNKTHRHLAAEGGGKHREGAVTEPGSVSRKRELCEGEMGKFGERESGVEGMGEVG